DVEPVHHVVVAGVDDRRDLFGRVGRAHPHQQPGGTDAAAQHGDHAWTAFSRMWASTAATPSSSLVQGFQPRWIEARRGSTALRRTSPGRAGSCTALFFIPAARAIAL